MRTGARLRGLPGRLLQQAHRGAELSVKVAAQDFEDLDQRAIADRIVNLVAHLAADDDLFGPEHSQMLRGIGLLDAKRVDQLSRR